MVLRPDVTPVIAQTFAQMRSPSLPFRVSYTHKIVRVERSFTTDQLESYQIGIEHIGGEEFLSDVEVILIALEVLSSLGLPNFQVSIADHKIANMLLKGSGAPRRIRAQIREALSARDADEVGALLDKLGARAEYVSAILAMASAKGGEAQLDAIRRAMPMDRDLTDRIAYIERLHHTLTELGWSDHVTIEMAGLGGPSYYTGIGFSLVSEGAMRELGRGGRYDSLVGLYGRSTPAVGFSLSLETIVAALHPHMGQVASAKDEAEELAVSASHAIEGFRRVLERRSHGAVTQVLQSEEF